jgi:tRNA U34 5-methylaminomethyl-2-thiouridine-forming methyltransferase MnmC
MPDGIQLITTADGSHSLLNTALDETYHSRHGAIQESLHVFINEGFDFVIGQNQLSEINILEIGFGTGLNALLTLQQATAKKIKVNYTSLETYPLQEAVWRTLNYGDAIALTSDFEKLHLAAWNEWQVVSEFFRLRKLNVSLQQLDIADKFDLVYYDAFAPSKQPEMWELLVLQKTISKLKPRGVFVTYCAKGQLKRDLKSLGLTVETLDGPPGKKEMVRAELF